MYEYSVHDRISVIFLCVLIILNYLNSDIQYKVILYIITCPIFTISNIQHISVVLSVFPDVALKF